MKKIFYITNIFPYYRKAIWKKLLLEDRYQVEFFYSNQPLNNIKSYNLIESEKFHLIKNYFFYSNLIWQSGVIIKVFLKRPDIVILLGEMSIISNWIITLICKALKIKVWFWGHGIYGNEGKLKLFTRKIYLNLADKNLLYGERARKILIDLKFKKQNLHVVYNSLDYEKHNVLYRKLHSFKLENNDLFKIVFIGRLTKKKKINMLFQALRLNNLNNKIQVEIIGEGAEKEFLINEAQKYSIEKIKFHGEIYDETLISKILYYSNLCVAPGNIGLTAVHSLTYGTPVLTHNNFDYQMPEAEAIIDGYNGYLFEYDNIEDLAKKIELAKSKKLNKGKVRKIIEDKYNPDFQKSIFDKIILCEKNN